MKHYVEMVITMTVPIKGYLKKYLYWKENLPLGDKITLSASSKIGMLLGGLLVEKVRAELHPVNTSDYEKIYDDTFTFEFSDKYFKSGRWCLSMDSIRYFNQYLYKDFHEALLLHVLINSRQAQIRETESIRNFLDTMNISEDDLGFEAVKKATYRERKGRDFELFRSVSAK